MHPSFPHDDELVYYLRQKCEWSESVILRKYHRALWAIIHSCQPSSVHQSSLEDLYQEGCIALLESAHHFREDLGVSFGHFARVCIEREIRSLLRRYRSSSYALLSHSLSLSMSVSEDENVLLMDTIANTDNHYDPIYMANLGFCLSRIDKIKEELGEDGWFIFNRHSEGYSYKEIGSMLQMSDKTVDNNLQRIRKKLASMFD
ncbi:MAG: sigma-70 family RNA polymerase sigma factor [Erysipelotrichaceae bacterium]|nr:sigma-70 family RNA polymerase sigma factor [Erysipelotrichaceae bacterium]